MNRRLNTAEAIKFVLAPGSDSELSELSDTDFEEEDEILEYQYQSTVTEDNQLNLEEDDNTECQDDESNNIPCDNADADDNYDAEDNDENDDVSEGVVPPLKKSKTIPTYRWRKKQPRVGNKNFLGENLSLPPDDELSPFQYFPIFWSEDIIENLVTQTNSYLVQKSGKSINVDAKEIEKFIGIQMFMSIIPLPSYELYWSKDFRIYCVANIMSMK